MNEADGLLCLDCGTEVQYGKCKCRNWVEDGRSLPTDRLITPPRRKNFRIILRKSQVVSAIVSR